MLSLAVEVAGEYKAAALLLRVAHQVVARCMALGLGQLAVDVPKVPLFLFHWDLWRLGGRGAGGGGGGGGEGL